MQGSFSFLVFRTLPKVTRWGEHTVGNSDVTTVPVGGTVHGMSPGTDSGHRAPLAGWWLGARLRLPCPPSGGRLPIYPWTARRDFLIQLWILQKCFEKNKTLEKRVVSRWLQFGSPNQTSAKASFRRLSNVPLSLPQVASRWPAPPQVEGRLPLPGHLPMGTPVR